MAFIEVNFYSESLKRIVPFNVLLPNDLLDGMMQNNKHYERPTKTLYLLHGYSGSSKDWLLGAKIQQLSINYNLAIILPTGENSFYVDAKKTGGSYGTYVGKELVEYTKKMFGLSPRREDTYIGGMSMGGFGAIRNGFKYSDTFSKIVSLSSALIIHNVKNQKEDYKDGIAEYYYYCSVFGDLEKLEDSEHNPETLIRNLVKKEKEIPEIYMACGTEDFLIKENRAFKAFLDKEHVKANYTEDVGIHDWDFWNKYLEPAIEWLI